MIFSQRNNVINNNNADTLSDDFLSEIIDDLKETKTKYLAKPNSNDFTNQFKSLFGKSFNNEEIDNLVNLKGNDFENLIRNKFLEKRNERINLIGEEKAKENIMFSRYGSRINSANKPTKNQSIILLSLNPFHKYRTVSDQNGIKQTFTLNSGVVKL